MRTFDSEGARASARSAIFENALRAYVLTFYAMLDRDDLRFFLDFDAQANGHDVLAMTDEDFAAETPSAPTCGAL